MDRLAWKEQILSERASTVNGAPIPLADALREDASPLTPVSFSGSTFGPEIHVLVSRKNIGAGYRVIAAFETEQAGKVLLDRGFIAAATKADQRSDADLDIVGNLHITDDRNSSTPANDVAGNIWFARDIDEMAKVLGTQPILVIARSDTGQGIEAMPLGVEGIPNDHLEYAITWFSLAIVWLGMTVFLLWRINRRMT